MRQVKTGAVRKTEQSESDTNRTIGTSRSEDKKINMVIINEDKINKLIDFFKKFGEKNYFKIFRTFYKLSVLPPDA